MLMAAWRIIRTEGLLIYLFTVYQEVSSFTDDCFSHICFNSFCCPQGCCTGTGSGTTSGGFSTPEWIVPTVAVFGVVFGCTCLWMLVSACLKCCKDDDESIPEDPPRNFHVPPPVTPQPMPTAPSLDQSRDPPPYSEVAWKPYFYPPPSDQPPCYDNIAMEGLPSSLLSTPEINTQR